MDPRLRSLRALAYFFETNRDQQKSVLGGQSAKQELESGQIYALALVMGLE